LQSIVFKQTQTTICDAHITSAAVAPLTSSNA